MLDANRTVIILTFMENADGDGPFAAGITLAASFLAAAMAPGRWALQLQMPFMLAATVMGYLIGTAIPSTISTVLHPLVTCALVANLGAYAYSMVSGLTFDSVAKAYMTKVCT